MECDIAPPAIENLAVSFKDLGFTAKDKTVTAAICIVELFGEFSGDYNYLSDYELGVFKQLGTEPRRKSFLLGRIAAKMAIARIQGSKPLNKIEIKNGVLNQPIVEAEGKPGMQISISHSEQTGVAAAFPHNILFGVDIEKLDDGKLETLQKMSSKDELKLALPGISPLQKFTILWTAREALSKCIKTGFSAPFPYFEVKTLTKESWGVSGDYSNFSKFKFASIKHKDSILTYCYAGQLTVNS